MFGGRSDFVKLEFVNRTDELRELDAAARRGGLLVVFGRRRVGKTRLLRHWMDGRGGMFSQALEGPVEMQVAQVFADVRDQLETRIEPRKWEDFLEIMGLQKKPWVLCLDEFPYLTAKDGSLPSRLQRWLDHDSRRVFADSRRIKYANDARFVSPPRGPALWQGEQVVADRTDGLSRVLPRLWLGSRGSGIV